MKILLGILMVSLLAANAAQADSRHGSRGGDRGHFSGRDHGRHGGHRHGGRLYYYGGLPYYYPISTFGFGDPYWYGGYSYYGSIDDRYYGHLRPYEGRIVNETAPGRAGLSKGTRSLPGAVQRQLAERGYYKGGIDGQFGAASKSALKKFQRDNKLRQTGLIDEASLEALGFGDR